jgi:hypothetical protein
MARSGKRYADGTPGGLDEPSGPGLKLGKESWKVGSLDGTPAPAPVDSKSKGSYAPVQMGEAKGFASGLASGISAGDAMNRAEGRDTLMGKAKTAASGLKSALGMADGGKVGGKGRYYGKK